MLGAERFQCLMHAVDGPQFALVEREKAKVLLGGGIGRETHAMLARHLVDHGGEGLADEAGMGLGLADHHAVLGQDLDVDLHRQGLAVDQHAVAIEYVVDRCHAALLKRLGR